MKQPVTLLVGIIISIILLSICFPSDPSKPDILTRISSDSQHKNEQVETVRNYRLGDIIKIDDIGDALIWSLDEQQIIYIRPATSDESIYEEIWISNTEGSKEKVSSKYKFNNIRNPKWSPDGMVLSFMGDIEKGKTGLFLYDIKSKTIRDITPKNISDVGVTSYDWDQESLYIVMSVDIVKPFIQLYNTSTKKFSKVDINPKSCRNVAFYRDDKILYSDIDENMQYKIYSADKSGRNINYITGGQDFILSPDKHKMAILSDIDSQLGLWVYDITSKNNKLLRVEPINNISWLSDSVTLIFAEEDDCRIRYTYSGSLYYLESNLQAIEITGAVYPIFTTSKTGKKVAMTSPDYIEDKTENKGLFVGVLYK